MILPSLVLVQWLQAVIPVKGPHRQKRCHNHDFSV